VTATGQPDVMAMMQRPQSRPDQDPTNLVPHPLALLIPEMGDDDFAGLKEDIGHRGLLEPVVLYEGRILDGRHRYRACQETGRRIDFTEYTGTDAVGYVMALNLHRRHLTVAQRAFVAAEAVPQFKSAAENRMLAGVAPDPATCGKQGSGEAVVQAARAVDVSPQSVRRARVIRASAPELERMVQAGEISLAVAAAEVNEMRRRDQSVHRKELAERRSKKKSNVPKQPDYASMPPSRGSPTKSATRCVESIFNGTAAWDHVRWAEVEQTARADLIRDLRDARTRITRAIRMLEADDAS
jgi:ParB-like chromosome segregation protein Spo0J